MQRFAADRNRSTEARALILRRVPAYPLQPNSPPCSWSRAAVDRANLDEQFAGTSRAPDLLVREERAKQVGGKLVLGLSRPEVPSIRNCMTVRWPAMLIGPCPSATA